MLILSNVWKISIWTAEFPQPSLHSGGRIVIIESPQAELERLEYLNVPLFSCRFSAANMACAGRFKTQLEGQQRIFLRKSATAANILRPSKKLCKKIQLPVRPLNGNISLYHSPSP